jgi:hypothetical protein
MKWSVLENDPLLCSEAKTEEVNNNYTTKPTHASRGAAARVLVKRDGRLAQRARLAAALQPLVNALHVEVVAAAREDLGVVCFVIASVF